MSKNRSSASLKKLLRLGYRVSLEEHPAGTYWIAVTGIESFEKASGHSVGAACAEVCRKLRI